jgi:hypothetical protein
MAKENIFLKWQASAPYLQSVLRMVAALMFYDEWHNETVRLSHRHAAK